MLTCNEAIWLFIVFAVLIIVAVVLKKEKHFDFDSFLLSNRKVSLSAISLSIAISWVWGPAIFLSSMQAYRQGIAGLTWFLIPNFTCFFIYAYFAKKFRQIIPEGYTLPEFMRKRYHNAKHVHYSYIGLTLLYQLTAIILNSVVGAELISLVSGIDANITIFAIVSIALIYSMISGFKASVFTDNLQIFLMYIFVFLAIPIAIYKIGGIDSILNSLGGITGENTNIFDKNILLYFAIPSFVTLWTGPIIDQMFYQRAMSSDKKHVAKSFRMAAFFYIIIPLMLSMLGFAGVHLENNGDISNVNEQLIGIISINALFGKGMIYFYCLMAICGLCSTIDSALCAISSIGSIDIYKDNILKKKKMKSVNKKEMLFVSRIFMFMMAFIGIIISFLRPSLICMFFIIGIIRAAGFFPTILSIFTNKIPAKAITISIYLTISLGLPLSIYANYTGNRGLNSFASLGSVLLPLLICGFFAIPKSLLHKFFKENSRT
jgi:urea-proton symporter